MFNYCSLGLDAKMCMGFHELRKTHPHLFKSQVGNKFIYTKLGANHLLFDDKMKLDEVLTIYCDG